jgi:outer membrane receptor protein involved in Fe transport
MNQVPGVAVGVTNGEGHTTAIRQPFTTSPVYLFLEDGIPTRSTGFFNHNALYEIDIPQAGGIEVVRGPGSALYGSDAVAGVINVLTHNPTLNYMPIAYRKVGAFRLSTTYERETGDSLLTVTPYFRHDSMDLLASFRLSFDPTVADTSNESYGVMLKWRKDFAPLRALRRSAVSSLQCRERRGRPTLGPERSGPRSHQGATGGSRSARRAGGGVLRRGAL